MYNNVFYLKTACSIYSFSNKNVTCWVIFVFPQVFAAVSFFSICSRSHTCLFKCSGDQPFQTSYPSLAKIPTRKWCRNKEIFSQLLEVPEGKVKIAVAATRPWCSVYLGMVFHIFFSLITSKVCTELCSLICFFFNSVHVCHCMHLFGCLLSN